MVTAHLRRRRRRRVVAVDQLAPKEISDETPPRTTSARVLTSIPSLSDVPVFPFRCHSAYSDAAMSDVSVPTLRAPFRASITPPGSKSLTNRALVLSALAEGLCTLSNVLFADDTAVMLDCLGKLGFDLEIDHAARTVRVGGRGGAIPATAADLFCGNS